MLMAKMIASILVSVFSFMLQSIDAAAIPPVKHPTKWMTLTGARPEVVANGGYSGIFPDSSQPAYDFALDTSLPGTILYCNLHFTKDNDGFCVAGINLQNATNLADVDPKGGKAYNVNGRLVHGWFGLDYSAKFIFENVTLNQNIFTRPGVFDGVPVLSPFNLLEDKDGKPTRLWLNIEYDLFYKEHRISAEAYLFEQLQQLPEFISSPEIGFLKGMKLKLGRSKTKLMLTFLGETELEPTTKKTYGSLVKELGMFKSFADGIVVPKDYIWPVNEARFLQPATALVEEAHRAGLTVYAANFANDNFLSFNYSYDPAKEYMNFIGNAPFSVDGFLSQFPSTASEAIGCLSANKNAPRSTKALIISHNGASGDFPGATDLAYEKAIADGADIIDCSVQVSKDGVAFCSDRADLLKTTTAAITFMDLSTNIPQIQSTDGIFSFDLTWEQIQSLQPQMESFFEGNLMRNPANKNKGKFFTISQFLELAKTRSVPGVLINIQNADFLASNKGLDIVGAVSTALTNASLDKQTAQKVFIESDDSSVLMKFKENPSYQRVFHLTNSIRDVPHQISKELKSYAEAVYVHRDAVIVASDNFAFNFTKTVASLHAANLSVFVGVLKNEFENLIFDYLSDPYIEIATFLSLKVDGLVTDYPSTANMFARSSCANMDSEYYIEPVQPKLLFEPAPVAEPPMLSQADVVDPPLPAITKEGTPDSEAPGSSNTSNTPPVQGANSSTTSLVVGFERFLILVAVAHLVLIHH